MSAGILNSNTPVSAPSVFALGNSKIGSVGFVAITGSLFRTYDEKRKYRDFNVTPDGTTSTTCYCGSSIRSLSCNSVDSDTLVSAELNKPYHFRHHQDSYDKTSEEKHLQTGDVVAEWFAMVHMPIPMKKALEIPMAKQAVDKEWKALEDLPAWDLSRVRPRAEVVAEAKKLKKSVHFGSLMDLCHEKGAEFNRPDNLKVYKGRVVFRGDQIRDETVFTVFS